MSSSGAPQSGTGHDPTRWEQAGELSRAIVRPVITVSGWGALLFIIVTAVVQFIDLNMAQTILISFLSTISMMIGFYFGQRQARKE